MQRKTKPTKNKRHPWLIAILILVLIIAGGITYKNYRDVQLDKADKQQFEAVRRSMKKLQGNLQELATSDEKWKLRSFCREGSVKFQEANKSCEIVLETSLVVVRDVQAASLIKKYNDEFRKDSNSFEYKGEGEPPTPLEFPKGLSEGYDGANFKEKATGMKYGSLYSIDEPKSRAEKAVFNIRFSCSKNARDLYYPQTGS